MSADYTPREGTSAHKAVVYFAANPDARLSAGELAGAIGVPPAGLSTSLKRAVDAGILGAEKTSVGYTYFRPEPPTPTDGDLEITTYSDGDVGVSGMAITDDGAVFTPKQLMQLLMRVTTPCVQLPARGDS